MAQPNPYVGPRPFENNPADIARFFGRSQEARNILSLVKSQRIVLVYGQSGTGKTSLLNAALIPSLVAQGWDVPPPARVQGVITSATANIYMANVVAGWAPKEPPAADLAEFLQRHPPPIDEDDEPMQRILIVDQFEELFTANPEHWAERRDFFEQIDAAQESNRHFRILFLIREDLIAEVDPYANILPGGFTARFRLEQLRPAAALEALTRPLVNTSRQYAPQAAATLLDELLTIPHQETPHANRPGAIKSEFVEPVVLQVVGTSLWNSLPDSVTVITSENVRQYAAVSGVLIRFYESCLHHAKEKTRATEPIMRHWFETQLITPAGTRGLVYRDTAQTGGLPNPTVDLLENEHLIRAEERASARWYELAHDRFIEPIRQSNHQWEAEIRRLRFRRILRIMMVLMAFVAVITIAAAVVISQYRMIVAPYDQAIDNLVNYTFQAHKTAYILAADGSEIAELTPPDGGPQTSVLLNSIAPEMIHAVVSVENENFFEDPGLDPIVLGRAFIQNAISGQVESGATTITQQIARNLIIQDTTVSPDRKLKEIVVAAEIARKYDKNFILQLYLNTVYFGNQSYGVEAASQFYFHHNAADLNLPEAAMLAGLIQAPAKYDPVINRSNAFARMDEVLNQMAVVGCLQFSFTPYDKQPFCISRDMLEDPQVILEKAQVVSRDYQPRYVTVKYPHFVNFIQQQIESNFDPDEMFQRGFQIRTTLLPNVQDVAQAALQAQVLALSNNGVNTGAVMVTNPRDGAILAMVGSPAFSDVTNAGQVNNVLTWQRPGSAILPVEYIGALEGVDRADGTHDYLTPASILLDVPTTFTNPDYTPVNDDRRFRGPVAVRFALANSYNVPAVKALNFIGLNKFVDVANRLGLRFLPENPPQNAGLVAALGANEVRLYDMMQMYGTIANNGQRAPLYGISGIKDVTGADVTLPDRPQPAQAIQPQVAFLIQNILSDNDARTAAFGANSPLVVNNFQGRVAAKTGTSNDNVDLWTMGFSSTAVVGVWIGRIDNRPMINISGLAAAPIWNTVMTSALQGTNPNPFTPPEGITQQRICADTGTLYDRTMPCTAIRTEYFLSNQPPSPANQGFLVVVPVDTWTGLLANQFCPDSTVNQIFANSADPSALAWLNTAPGMTYARSVGLAIPVQSVPSAACTASTSQPVVRFISPQDRQQVTGMVPLNVIVSGKNLSHYQIELAPASAPDNFQIIAGPVQSQANGVLTTWDSGSVPNGVYRLRLAAFSTEGGYRYATIDIGVNAILPTSTPLPMDTPTPPPLQLSSDPLIRATELVRQATQTAGAPLTMTASAVFGSVMPTPTPTMLSPQAIRGGDPFAMTVTAIFSSIMPTPTPTILQGR